MLIGTYVNTADKDDNADQTDTQIQSHKDTVTQGVVRYDEVHQRITQHQSPYQLQLADDERWINIGARPPQRLKNFLPKEPVACVK